MSTTTVSKPSAPYAVCPADREPLISTFEVAYKEFLCMVCGRRYEFLQPHAAEPTPELDARYEDLHARFVVGERPTLAAAVQS